MCEEGFPGFPDHVCANFGHRMGKQEDDGCRERAVNEEGEGGGDVVQFPNFWGRKERHGEEGLAGLLSGWLCGEPLGARRRRCTVLVRLELGARLWVGYTLLFKRSWGGLLPSWHVEGGCPLSGGFRLGFLRSEHFSRCVPSPFEGLGRLHVRRRAGSQVVCG